MTTMQYRLVVKNGKTDVEEGHFFKALPFDISNGKKRVHCEFKKGSKGKVVQQLRMDNKVIAELEHPDYVPETAPENAASALSAPADKDMVFLFAALVKLNIANSKDYSAYFLADNRVSDFSYEVTQLKRS